MKPRPTIALLTDFGPADWFVGSMKAVILSRLSDCTIVDLCHAIEPGAVGQAAWILERTFREFPPATIFCAVVDPEVGTERRAIVASGNVEDLQAGGLLCRRYFFVAPDNGLLTGIRRHVADGECRVISNEQWMRLSVSRTFHGRDIFAPAAAQVAIEGGIESAGDLISDPVEIELPGATVAADGTIEGTVIYFDRFGNAITTIERAVADASEPKQRRRIESRKSKLANRKWSVAAENFAIERVSSTYADVMPGEAAAYWGSLGTLEIAVRNGNARERLGLSLGERICLRLRSQRQKTRG